MKIIGAKKEMTQLFDNEGRVWPATVVVLNEKNGDLTVGEEVKVSGVTKGKGFQGVVKRHGFAGGPRTHGQKHSEREPGSIGGGLRNRVPKGMRMGGRMGGNRITVQGLKILAIGKDGIEVLVSGALPGRRGTKLEIRKV